MIAIILQGTLLRLDQLDDQERAAIEMKALREKAAQAPRREVPKGIGAPLPIQRPEEGLKKILAKMPPEKIKANYRRWAEWLEDADNDPLERKIRMSDIARELREKTKDAVEAKLCADAFAEFLEERDASRVRPLTVKVDPSTIEGAID